MSIKKIIPEIVCWESTLACNFNCQHCGLNARTARDNELNSRKAENMFQELNRFGIQRIVISGGEFTVREDWQELLSCALSLFENVRIITNGYLGEKLISILESLDNSENLVLSLSLDGMQKFHDYRRQFGSFSKIKEILQAPTQMPKVVLTTVDKNNFSDLDEVFNLCLKNNVDTWIIQIGLPAGRMKKEDFIGVERIPEIVTRIESWQKRQNLMQVAIDDCLLIFMQLGKVFG